jgi:hypothetical protein
MLYDLDGEPNQSIYELDKCVVMNEEIFGCAGLVRRGDAIAIDSEKTGMPKNQFGFHSLSDRIYYEKELAKARLLVTNTSQILEIGFGNGNFLGFCRDKHWHVTGICPLPSGYEWE